MTRARPVRTLATCCLLWLATLAPAVAAQTVPVRSGAHDGFVRLVLDLPGRRSWHLVTRDNGASVVFDGAPLRFDLGAVFDRIGRQRLRAVSAAETGARLDLVFACDCRIAPFWHAGDMLVIDIKDAPSAAPVRPRQRTLTPTTAKDQPPAYPRATAGAALAARLDDHMGPRVTALPETGTALSGFDAMRAALDQQIGRAARQGLVTPAPNPHRQTRAAARRAPVAAVPDAPPPAGPGQAASGADHNAAPGMRISTSMDRDTVRSPHRAPPAEICPPVRHIDVPAWGGSQPFALEVGRLNGALFGEFDTIRKAEALRLARLYIHHGFGAEARQVLGWLDADTPDVTRAAALARLVDGGPLPAGAALGGALGCGQPAVLWAILARAELPTESVLDHRALLRSFVALPGGLRRALGPGLVQRLAAAGHHRTADALLRDLRGGDALSDAATGLARAALAGETGADTVAQQALQTITRTNTRQTGAALAETIERALARGAPVNFDDAQLSGALAFEHRGTPLGGRLALAYVSALAASGAFDEAMHEFERLRPSASDSEAARVAAVLVSYLERQADDITFLRATMTDRVVSPEALGSDVALDVARRLLALGFPAQAARYVAPAQGAGPVAARRVLRARIALAQDQTAAALGDLRGLDGDQVDLLRAEALAALGDNAAAERLFDTREATHRADSAALRTGRAEIMAEAEDASLREIGSLLARDAATPAAEGRTEIASHRALLERSTALRGAMVRLLRAKPAQSAAN